MSGKHIVYLVIIFFGASIGWLFINRMSNWLRLIVILLWCTFISEFISRMLVLSHQSNSVCHFLFAPIQLGIICMVYHELYRVKLNKVLVRVTMFAYLVFFIADVCYFEEFGKLPSNLMLASGFIISTFSLILLKQLLVAKSSYRREFFRQITFITSNLLFQAGTFLFWGIHNQILYSIPQILYVFLYVINVFYYLSLTAILLSAIFAKQLRDNGDLVAENDFSPEKSSSLPRKNTE